MRVLALSMSLLCVMGCACAEEPIVAIDAGRDAAGHDDDGGQEDAGETVARCGDVVIEPWDLTTGVWSPVFAPSGVSLDRPERAIVRAIEARDGDVVVGGRFTHAGPLEARNVAGWTELEGWRALGDGVDGEVTALARGADGALFVARTIDATEAAVLRFRDGVWESIGDANGEIVAVAVAPDGALIAGGGFWQIGEVSAALLARFDGTSWAPIAHPLARVSSILVDASGLCIGGGATQPEVACLPAGASEWQVHPFPSGDAGSDVGVHALARDGSGALVAGGTMQLAAATLPEAIVRWDGSAWAPLGGGVSGPVALVRALARDDSGALWIAGTLTQLGETGLRGGNVAAWDGAWLSVGGVARSWTVDAFPDRAALAVVSDGFDVYVGGELDGASGSVSARGIVRWRGETWSALRHPGATGHGIGPGQLVRARGACEPIVLGSWIGGEEAGLGAAARLSADDVLQLPRETNLYMPLAPQVAIARDGTTWGIGLVLVSGPVEPQLVVSDGGAWAAVPAPDGEPVMHARALAIDPIDDTVYVGASFGTTHLMARVNGRWERVGDRDVGEVHAIAIDEERALWIAESMDETRVRLARWDGATWTPSAAFEGTVARIVILDGAPVATVDGPGGAIVRRLRGSVFEPLDAPSAFPTRVSDIVVHEGVLLAAGIFTIDGAPHMGLARWEDGTWRAIGGPLDAVPESLAITERGVVVVGAFETAGGAPSAGIARLEPSP